MSPIETLLTYPLTPSELVLLNGEAFAPLAGLGDRLPLLNSEVAVSASALVRAMLAASFLAAEQAGAVQLEARARPTPFGPSKLLTLFVEPGEASPAWPATSLEARLPPLAGRLRSGLGAPEAGAVVYAWLEADTRNPWHQAAALVQRGLAERGMLEIAEVVQFGFVKTKAYRLTANTAALAAQGPSAVAKDLLEECAQHRPEVWARLVEQIDGGLRRRLAAPAPTPRRQADEDE